MQYKCRLDDTPQEAPHVCPADTRIFGEQGREQFPVILLSGARQVGKTTLLRHLSQGSAAYVTLDDPLVLSLAKTDPALFMQRFLPPMLIDEIQYAVELLPHIKMAADRSGQSGQFWLTGSQQFHLMKGVSESLAGRVAVLHLLGLSRSELLGQGADASPFLPTPEEIARRSAQRSKLTLKELYRLIWRGSLPAIVLNPTVERDLFFSSYVQTYLQRDLRDLARVGDELAFLRFLRVRRGPHRPDLEPGRPGPRRGYRPEHGQKLALDPTNGRNRLSAGAVPHQCHPTFGQGAQDLSPRHRPGRLPDRMGQPGDIGSRRDVRRDPGDLDRR